RALPCSSSWLLVPSSATKCPLFAEARMGIEVKGPQVKGSETILTREALALVERLHRELNPRRQQLLARRAERQRELDRGEEFHFLPEGKQYKLDQKIATLLVRPRGWHLPEKHVLVDGEPISGSLIDFGLTLFHNAREQLDRGTGPYFYLPKLESHLEARLWNDAFVLAQDALKIPRGSIRATVLVETLPAAFEMDEILYELRDHMSGLNAGRWDYTFSLS